MACAKPITSLRGVHSTTCPVAPVSSCCRILSVLSRPSGLVPASFGPAPQGSADRRRASARAAASSTARLSDSISRRSMSARSRRWCSEAIEASCCARRSSSAILSCASFCLWRWEIASCSAFFADCSIACP